MASRSEQGKELIQNVGLAGGWSRGSVPQGKSGWTPTVVDSFLWMPTWGKSARRVWRRHFLALNARGGEAGEVHPGMVASLLQNLVQWLVH